MQTLLKLGCTQMTMSSSPEMKGDFVAAYIKAFAGPPYFEKYGFEEVLQDVLMPHLRHGFVVAIQDLLDDGRLVGFGCALPFQKCPDDVKEYFERLHQDGLLPEGLDHHQAWYMSELGVNQEYRGHGLAYELVQKRALFMESVGANQYFMRTDSEKSNSMHMYLKIGSKKISVLQDVSESNQATENKTQSLERVYLWGSCRQAIDSIDRIRSEGDFLTIQAI